MRQYRTSWDSEVREVLLEVGVLGRCAVGPEFIDAWIDRIEDAADEDRPPVDGHAEFARERLHVVKREPRPRARAVEKELDHGFHGIVAPGQPTAKYTAHSTHGTRVARIRDVRN